jgi:hypothetical protein
MPLRRSRIALGLVLALAGFAARAESVRINDFTILGPSGLSVVIDDRPHANWHGAAGQFDATLNGASFATYCLDLQQYASFGVTYSGYQRADATTVFGAAKAEDLAKLLTHVGMSTMYSTDSAMVQAAIWEVVYERGRRYDFGSGNAVTTGLDASTQDWLNALDWKAVRKTTPTFDLDVLVHANQQDLLVATPIPEPSTYALMAGGLAVVGFIARRRAKRD